MWAGDLRKSKVGEARPRTVEVKCKDGSEKVIHFRPLTMENGDQFVIYDDITEEKRLEAQFQQAQKMEAVGTLAGGIAHDFNNLLMGIQGRVSLMSIDAEFSHLHVEHLKGIEEHVRSAAELSRQLLGLARGGKYEVKPADLNEVIEKSTKMFGRTKKEITIYRKLPENIWTVEIDQGQIEQVLLNLYVNAWQSMPAGGELYLETKNTILDEGSTKPFGMEPGRFVEISVTDTGAGMDKATQERIFEPFFTTRGMGRGTGLGLASAYGIIKNHGGIINVNSEKGHGSTFRIYLPASDKEAVQEEASLEKVLKGKETVLLVDDEDMILDVGKQILEEMGYRCLVAKGGKKATELFKEKRDQIDLVILDMIMPDMGGGETYRILKKINPRLKVLLSSGYSIEGKATEMLKRGCNGFIQKPFNMKALSYKLREILEEG
jgi:nitrogen-specific signal transduction histidine kinase/CheY-like chemotaxis protein